MALKSVPPFLPLVAKIRRTESVPSDINNPVDRPAEAPQFGTLPKALTKKVTTHFYWEHWLHWFSRRRLCLWEQMVKQTER